MKRSSSNEPPSQRSSPFASRVVGIFFYAFIAAASLCLLVVSALMVWAVVSFLGYVSGDHRITTAIGGGVISLFASIVTVPVGTALMSLFVTHEYDGKASPVLATLGAIFLPVLAIFVNWFALFPAWLVSPVACGLLCYNLPAGSAAWWAALVAPAAGVAAGVLVVADILNSGESNS